MSQIFDEKGNVVPVTLVLARPVVVTQIKNKEKDGYDAIQLGYGERKEKHMKKAQKGHLKKIKNGAGKIQNIKKMKEFRGVTEELKEGDVIDVSVFKEGDIVKISGISKGKGFQGVVKRHGFKGGPRTHGQKHSEREPGSIGATWPQRVIKGMRMAGRMGNQRVTIKNLEVVKVNLATNIIAIKGALPGARGALIEIRGR